MFQVLLRVVWKCYDFFNQVLVRKVCKGVGKRILEYLSYRPPHYSFVSGKVTFLGGVVVCRTARVR